MAEIALGRPERQMVNREDFGLLNGVWIVMVTVLAAAGVTLISKVRVANTVFGHQCLKPVLWCSALADVQFAFDK